MAKGRMHNACIIIIELILLEKMDVMEMVKVEGYVTVTVF